MNKRGQVTIYIIIALVIVGVVLLFFFYPGVREIVVEQEISPISYLQECLEPEIRPVIADLSGTGGYSSPEGYVLYQGKNVKYLCYTSQYYETCVVQQPMIKNHFEKELESIMGPKADSCLNSLKETYERRGYDVSSSQGDANVVIAPGKIRFTFETPMTVTKDTTQTFNGFTVDLESKMYELLFIAQSIVDFEATYGDSETTLYTQYYPNLKIEKVKLGDGTTVYTLSNVVTGEKFTFASRSLAWPPGYGLG